MWLKIRSVEMFSTSCTARISGPASNIALPVLILCSCAMAFGLILPDLPCCSATTSEIFKKFSYPACFSFQGTSRNLYLPNRFSQLKVVIFVFMHFLLVKCVYSRHVWSASRGEVFDTSKAGQALEIHRRAGVPESLTKILTALASCSPYAKGGSVLSIK